VNNAMLLHIAKTLNDRDNIGETSLHETP
jgi:hypothetical protein